MKLNELCDEKSRTCPNCGDRVLFDRNKGERYCSSCGEILEECHIDRSQEWRLADKKEKEKNDNPIRSGSARTLTIFDRGLTTHIGGENENFRRLRRRQNRAKYTCGADRRLSKGLEEVEKITSALGISRAGKLGHSYVKEEASRIYRKFFAEVSLAGLSVEGVASACAYIAYRIAGFPRTLEEVESISPAVDKSDITRAYRKICSKLDINLPPIDPLKLVPRFCSKLDMSRKEERTAYEILKEAKKKEFSYGKRPNALVGGAIYIASALNEIQKRNEMEINSIPNKGLSQKEVAWAVNSTIPTIRNAYKDMEEKINLEKIWGKILKKYS